MALLGRLFTVEKEELPAVLRFFALSLLLGVPQFLTITVSTARFLEVYQASDLPLTYIFSGAIIIAGGLLLLRFQRRFPPEQVLPVMLLLLCLGSYGLFFLNLLAPAALRPRLLLQLWVDVEFIFCNFIFWQSASRTFPLRTAKRVYGIIGAGAVCSALGLGVFLLLALDSINPLFLLLFSSVSLTGGLALLLQIFRRHPPVSGAPASRDPEREGEGEEGQDRDEGGLLSGRYRPYALMIIALVLLEFFTHFYLDNVFFLNAEDFLPKTEQLMLFMGIFGALAALLKLLVRVFVSGRFLQRFGILGGLFFPTAVLLAVFLLYGTARELGLPLFSIFSLITAARFLETLLMGSVYAPAYYTLFQPFSPYRQGRFLNLADLVAAQAAAIAAGASLLLLRTASLQELLIAPVTLAALLIWALSTLLVSRRYRDILAAKVSRQSLLRLSDAAAQPAAVPVLQDFIASPYPEESSLAEELLGEYHPALSGHPPGGGAPSPVGASPTPARKNQPSRENQPSRKDKTSLENLSIPELARVRTRASLERLLSLYPETPVSLRKPLLAALQEHKDLLREEDYPILDRGFLRESKRIAALYQAVQDLADQGKAETALLEEAFRCEISKSRERLFRILSLLYTIDTVMGAYQALLTENTEKADFAIELLDTLLKERHKRLMLPLLENQDPGNLTALLTQLLPLDREEAILLSGREGFRYQEEGPPNPWIQECLRHLRSQDKGNGGGEGEAFSLTDQVLLLAESPLFSGIPHEDLALLAREIEIREEPAETRIIRKDEYGSALYLVAQGKVKVHTPGRLIAELGSGTVFGELSALSPEKRTASITALTPVRLIYLDGKSLSRFLSGHPDAALALMATICRRIRNTLRNQKPYRGSSPNPALPRGEDLTQLEKMICLQSLPLFQEIPREELFEFCRRCRTVSYAEGEILFEEGWEDLRIFILLSGEVRLEGPPGFCFTYPARTLLGELSALDNGPREGRAAAVRPSLCLEISSFRWKSLLREQPAAAARMMQTVIEKLRALME